MKLGTKMTFPVADVLMEGKKPFIFSTGFDEAALGYRRPVLIKPYAEARLGELIARFCLRD
jgi:hypothetical protein